MADPVLRTERLVLRPVTASYAPDLLCPRPNGFPRADDASMLAGVLASGDDGHGVYVVELQGEPIGTVGCAGGLSPEGDRRSATAWSRRPAVEAWRPRPWAPCAPTSSGRRACSG